jgi:hypothetical protein
MIKTILMKRMVRATVNDPGDGSSGDKGLAEFLITRTRPLVYTLRHNGGGVILP